MLAQVMMRTPFLSRRLRWGGLTLVEILVGLGVLSVLLAVAAPSMLDLMDRRRVIAATEEVSGILTYARAEINATNSPVLNVRFDPDPSGKVSCALVHTNDASGNCQCYLDPGAVCVGSSAKVLRLFQLPKGQVEFSAGATTWAGPVNRIKFMRDQMNLESGTTNFHIDVVGKKAKLKIEINGAGRVKVCSPDGNMTGYARCA